MHHPAVPRALRPFLLTLALLASSFLSPAAHAQTYTLGESVATEGAAAGTDSVVLAVSPSSGAWAATANDTWLHTSQSGTGSANVIYTFDANPGPTRSGTLTIGGQTLTVTQAGASFVSAVQPVVISSGVLATSAAVDSSGIVYFPDYYNGKVKAWNPATGQTTDVLTGLTNPRSLTMDGQGNLYVADDGAGVVYVWNPSTQTKSNLFSFTSVTSSISDLAVDPSGNVYFIPSPEVRVCEWIASTQTINPSVAIANGSHTAVLGLAVDAAGNVYFGDPYDGCFKEYNVSTGQTTVAVPGIPGYSGGTNLGLVVDGTGDIYFTNGTGTVAEWDVATQQYHQLEANLSYPQGLAIDSAGNLYPCEVGNAQGEQACARADR